MINTNMNIKTKILLYTNSLILLSSSILGPIYAIYLDQIGANLFEASMAMGIFAIVAGITTYCVGNYVDKHDPCKIIVVGYFLIGFSFLMYNFVNSLMGIYLLQIIIGLGEAIYSPAFDKIYTESMPKSKIGSTWGIWELSNYFSQALGAIIGGLLAEFLGFNSIFSLISIMCFIGSFWVYRSKELASEMISYE